MEPKPPGRLAQAADKQRHCACEPQDSRDKGHRVRRHAEEGRVDTVPWRWLLIGEDDRHLVVAQRSHERGLSTVGAVPRLPGRPWPAHKRLIKAQAAALKERAEFGIFGLICITIQ